MAREAKSSLGFIEERIRRLLSLSGDIGTEFKADASLVVIAGDASSPGCSINRGRRFASMFDVQSGVTASQTFKAAAPVVLTHYTMSSLTAGVQVEARTLAPDQADPYVIATAGGSWLENLERQADRPPLLTAAVVQPLTLVGTTFHSYRTQANGVVRVDLNMHLPLGGRLHFCFQNAAPATYAALTVFGYTF